MAKTNTGQKKLSRTYRFKKKAGIVKKRIQDNEQKSDAKKGRIVIRNLPFKITEADIQNLYKPFGEIEEINLLKRPDGKLVGCGFVQFKKVEDASKAIFKTNKIDFKGRTISSEWAIPKSEFYESIKKEEKPEVKSDFEVNQSKNEEEVVTLDKEEEESPKKRKNKFSNKKTLTKAEQRKLQKLKKRKKRSRIVLRNLPFTITENIIKEHFSKYGNIEDINILKKPNGSPTGVCFLQFERVQSAAQAIHYENMKQILERPMVVDWAVPKDKFLKSKGETEIKTEIKEEKEELDIENIKKEEESCSEDEVKEEDQDEDEIKEEEEDEDEEIKKESDNSQSSDNEDDESLDEDDDFKDKKNFKLESDEESTGPRRISNDVTEGKTVFIKNVPFNATNEDLKQCMEQFGPVYYALICIDRLTEHSKGTAFVKFRNVEDAEKCLSAGTELKLNDQILDPHRALHRNEINEKNEDKTKKQKDSRNLYLVKEGVVLASSPAAADVSASDMAKRLQMEKWKSQMLRNLTMFVSKVRLVIHNLPPSLDDSKLRQIFKNHSNPKAVITEARVMRDLKNLDANGIGKSKEYGFVCFTSHDDALKALRSINNNPKIFSKTQRPIVAFSIENRVMINAKKRRMEKSRLQNPLYGKRAHEESSSKDNNVDKHEPSSNKKIKNRSKDEESFAGTMSKPGNTMKNSKFFFKKQSEQHMNNLREAKKKTKRIKQMALQKKEQAKSRKEIKPKQGKKKQDADETNFNRLVNNYKSKLSAAVVQKSKWYET